MNTCKIFYSIIHIPIIASTKPIKKLIFGKGSLRKMTEQIATKKGTTETIIPTFDAIVYKRAMFSNKK